MLEPIYNLLLKAPDSFNEYRLGLEKDELVIFYKTYQSTDLADMQAIVDQQLAPGKTLEQTNQNLLQSLRLHLVILVAESIMQWFSITTIQIEMS